MSRCILIVKETEFALWMKGHEKTGNDEFEVVPYLCLLVFRKPYKWHGVEFFHVTLILFSITKKVLRGSPA